MIKKTSLKASPHVYTQYGSCILMFGDKMCSSGESEVLLIITADTCFWKMYIHVQDVYFTHSLTYAFGFWTQSPKNLTVHPFISLLRSFNRIWQGFNSSLNSGQSWSINPLMFCVVY